KAALRSPRFPACGFWRLSSLQMVVLSRCALATRDEGADSGMPFFSRFGNREQPVRRRCLDDLFAPGWPEHFDGVDSVRLAETEIERDGTLSEMAGFAIVILRPGTAGRMDLHRGAKTVPIGFDADQLDAQPMNSFAVGEVADQHLRAVVEFEGHDVQIAVVVQIKNHR